jgi:tetratricopeptide (TPR) repeat protein
MEEATYRFEQVLAAYADHGGALMGLGDALAASGRQADAVVVFKRLIKAEPDNAAAHYALGQVQKQLGAFADSREVFARAVALAPDNPSLHYALAESAPFFEDDARLAALEALARDEARFPDRQKAELHFALFKAYDELKRPDQAFAELEKGNRLTRALVPYDEAEVYGFFRELKETYTQAAMAALAGAGHPTALPVFVVGMPRSGTTLVEQILASHPDVFGAGELLYVQDLILGGFAGSAYPAGLKALGAGGLRRFGGYYTVRLAGLAPKAGRIVDKLPANFRHLGLLHLALPQAQIIHVRRDPADTCFSCYSKLFASGLNYTYDLGELGRYFRAYETLMAHWRAVLPPGAMLEVQYETLIENFETEARRLVEFCGLEWDERCLKFYETKRAVRTLSEFQVRRPLFKSSIGRWRPYEKWLRPLLDVLG